MYYICSINIVYKSRGSKNGRKKISDTPKEI